MNAEWRRGAAARWPLTHSPSSTPSSNCVVHTDKYHLGHFLGFAFVLLRKICANIKYLPWRLIWTPLCHKLCGTSVQIEHIRIYFCERLFKSDFETKVHFCPAVIWFHTDLFQIFNLLARKVSMDELVKHWEELKLRRKHLTDSWRPGMDDPRSTRKFHPRSTSCSHQGWWAPWWIALPGGLSACRWKPPLGAE